MSSYSSSNDSRIIGTADDALWTKQAAVQTGYYSDSFISTFSAADADDDDDVTDNARLDPRRRRRPIPQHFTQQQRRRPVPPMIKRGTFARVAMMDRAIEAYLETIRMNAHQVGQIVVLGSGKDTSYFRYLQGELIQTKTPPPAAAAAAVADSDEGRTPVRWYEVDHPSVIQNKARLIQQNPSKFLQSQVKVLHHQNNVLSYHILPSNQQSSSVSSSSSSLQLVGWDLRHDQQQPHLGNCTFTSLFHGFDPSLPTLFLMECVQMYLPQSVSERLWQTIAQAVSNATAVVYDPILQLRSPFGQTMETNLRRAGIIQTNSHTNINNNNNNEEEEDPISLCQTRTLQQHFEKIFRSSPNYQCCAGMDLSQAYRTILTMDQQQHANRCDRLDEWEELELIFRHYCLVVASTKLRQGIGICRRMRMIAEKPRTVNNKTTNTKNSDDDEENHGLGGCRWLVREQNEK